MKANDERCPEQVKVFGKITALLLLVGMIVSLAGCTVDEVCVLAYTSSAEVKPVEKESPAVVGSSPFPWDVVLSGASDILTGARKKAIEEKVGYRESRSFSLFRIKSAVSQREQCGSAPKEAGDASERPEK